MDWNEFQNDKEIPTGSTNAGNRQHQAEICWARLIRQANRLHRLVIEGMSGWSCPDCRCSRHGMPSEWKFFLALMPACRSRPLDSSGIDPTNLPLAIRRLRRWPH